MEESLTDFLSTRLENKLNGKCDCKQQQMCGICFWRGITKSPSEIPECRKCKKDTENFHFQCKSWSKNIPSGHPEFKTTHAAECLQYPYWHQKRERIRKNMNIKKVRYYSSDILRYHEDMCPIRYYSLN